VAPDRSDAGPPAAPPPAPAPGRSGGGWWRWPLIGTGLVGLVIVGGLLGYWVFMNIAARLVLSDQPMTIRLPEQADIVLSSQNKIDVLMKGTIYAQVPLKQTLDLPINGDYRTEVEIDTQVPLETIITYEGIIPIDTMADIEAKAPASFQNVKKFKNLHFKAKLPMKMQLPVKLVVPVKQIIPLRYRGPLLVRIDHVIRTPVDTVLKTALNVNQEFSVPITSSLPVRLDLPQSPVKSTIVHSDLNLDLSTLRLERKPEAGAAPAASP
jgi:hypothetical protein